MNVGGKRGEDRRYLKRKKRKEINKENRGWKEGRKDKVLERKKESKKERNLRKKEYKNPRKKERKKGRTNIKIKVEKKKRYL